MCEHSKNLNVRSRQALNLPGYCARHWEGLINSTGKIASWWSFCPRRRDSSPRAYFLCFCSVLFLFLCFLHTLQAKDTFWNDWGRNQKNRDTFKKRIMTFGDMAKLYGIWISVSINKVSLQLYGTQAFHHCWQGWDRRVRWLRQTLWPTDHPSRSLSGPLQKVCWPSFLGAWMIPSSSRTFLIPL